MVEWAIIKLTGGVCRYETHVPYPKCNQIQNSGDYLTVPDVPHISLFRMKVGNATFISSNSA